jgi:type I restriction enzyme R subunit
LIYDRNFKSIIDQTLLQKIIYIQKLGNQAAHSNVKIKKEDALLALDNLHDFMLWVTYLYCENYVEHKFDESLTPNPENNKELEKQKIELLKKLEENEKTIEQLQKQYETLRKETPKVRKAKQNTIPYDIKDISEFKTRKQYIDLDLEISGWEFNRNIVEEQEVTGMPNATGIGYVDYVLNGANGKPVGLVEAKKTSVNPSIGQQQAKIYADCLEKEFGQRPVIFYSNGFDIYMWDDTNYPPRKVSGYYTQEQLQLLIDRRTLKKDLRNISIDENITNRTYQQEAIKSFCDDLRNNQRKGLLVMATGTGKTRTAVSIVDVLTNCNWVKNVLFLADRTELVKQAKKSFNKLMPSLSTINLTVEKENAENARMVFSTYQTMMNAIDDVKTKDGKKLFTVGHFDLIIVDEAHRSIYKKYQAIFDYFDGLLLGLTATPRSDIDKNTYKIFELQDNVPTYSYEYEEAVNAGFLVDYHTIECSTGFIREGIKYNDLSEEDKEEYEETFKDDEDVTDTISSGAMFTWLFNENTIDQILCLLMEKGLKVESNDKLGKTIIFAKNHKHAEVIAERFNKLYPQYNGHFARVIDNHVKFASNLIEDFSDVNKMPQIAISVDMMDTGIDVPEVVNLVFFKEVKSKVKFLQMIGRGTRLCSDLFGWGKDKKEFYIFDACQNFEFFDQNPKGKESTLGISISQFIFELKVDLLKELEKIQYLNDDDYVKYKNILLEELVDIVNSLNTLKFDVKQKMQYVEKYKDAVNWNNLTDLQVKEIKDNLTHLIMSNDNDESAKQFDRLMLAIELSKMLNIKFNREASILSHIGEGLLGLMNIPQVQIKNEDVKKIMESTYIERADIFEVDRIRDSLRELIKYLPKNIKKSVYTDFSDDINIVEHDDRRVEQEEFTDYKKKMNFYLRNHLDNEIINKIRNNEKITPEEINELQQVLFNDLNSNVNEFNLNYNNESLVLLVRKTVGLSKEAVDKEFAKYINENELNVEQTRFINLIKAYIVKNGVIDKRILNEDPFTSYGSILQIFEGQINLVQIIIMIINLINGNGCYTQQNA